jgi:hypothetical protein
MEFSELIKISKLNGITQENFKSTFNTNVKYSNKGKIFGTWILEVLTLRMSKRNDLSIGTGSIDRITFFRHLWVVLSNNV